MEKLYCFQYDVNENTVYRQSFDVEHNSFGFFYHDNNGETIYVSDGDIDMVQTYRAEGSKIIYIYTKTDDVNHAMDVMAEAFVTQISSMGRELHKLKNTYDTFSQEKDRINKKYPEGKKSEEYGRE